MFFITQQPTELTDSCPQKKAVASHRRIVSGIGIEKVSVEHSVNASVLFVPVLDNDHDISHIPVIVVAVSTLTHATSFAWALVGASQPQTHPFISSFVYSHIIQESSCGL